MEICGERFEVDAAGFTEAVALAYATHRRPRCLCRPEGVEMYVATLGDGFIVKRMPETGCHHAPECPSFESPTEASGRGPLIGTAIREDPASGITSLRLDFSLTQGPSRPPLAPGCHWETSTATSRGGRLSLRGLLHYLWDQAALTRWQPGFNGKRSWAVVRHRLRQAAACHTVNGRALQNRLYIPESFSADHWEAIRSRRSAFWSATTASQSGDRPLMLLVAELKELGPARHGFKATMKHMPDLGFMLDERLFLQATRRFERQFALWSASDDIRMLTIATFSISPSGIPLVVELSLMPTTREWLPVESTFERQLIARLIGDERSFMKCLRYDLRSDASLATAALTDCGSPTPLLYIASQASPDQSAEQSPGSALDARWQWVATETRIPPLPPALQPGQPTGRP